MKSHKQLPNYVLVLGITAAAAAALFVSIGAGAGVGAKQKEAGRATKLPEVISNVRGLEVVGVTVKGEGTTDAVAVIEVRNRSDKPAIAFAVESGGGKDAAGVTVNGFNDGGEPPTIVLEPHQTRAVNFSLGNVMPGHPIRVGGVMYADGTEEGDENTLGTMRRQKAHYKAGKRGN